VLSIKLIKQLTLRFKPLLDNWIDKIQIIWKLLYKLFLCVYTITINRTGTVRLSTDLWGSFIMTKEDVQNGIFHSDVPVFISTYAECRSSRIIVWNFSNAPLPLPPKRTFRIRGDDNNEWIEIRPFPNVGQPAGRYKRGVVDMIEGHHRGGVVAEWRPKNLV